MIILDQPYVSEFLINTILENRYPVLRNGLSESIFSPDLVPLLDDKEASQYLLQNKPIRLYTPSEHSIDWIVNHLAYTDIPDKINIFKDKVRFRQTFAPLFPSIFYRVIPFTELENLNVDRFPSPLVLKPAKGFFSMAVARIENQSEYNHAVEKIKKELETLQSLYPVNVLDTSDFIVEQYIRGKEFAFDAYFDSMGDPVILNIWQHLFSSEHDVSDRVYITSADIVNQYLERFQDVLNKIRKRIPLFNFPMHVEVRIDEQERLFPIEINPYRFGGWCTTADMSFHAYGINLYHAYFNDIHPRWPEQLKNMRDRIFSIIVLDNSTGVDAQDIIHFNYDKLLSGFEKPVELRKINYKTWPVFGFLFTETRAERFFELENILKSDLTEYVETQKDSSGNTE
jgi:hypothetical protein